MEHGKNMDYEYTAAAVVLFGDLEILFHGHKLVIMKTYFVASKYYFTITKYYFVGSKCYLVGIKQYLVPMKGLFGDPKVFYLVSTD